MPNSTTSHAASHSTAGNGTSRSDGRGPMTDTTRATMPTASAGKTSCWPSATIVVNFGLGRPVRVPDLRQQLARHLQTEALDQRLCWTPKSSSFCGSSPMTCGSIRNTPPLEVRAQHQVEILRQRVMRPAARLLDGDAAPDTAGAVELERHAARGRGRPARRRNGRPASDAARASASCARRCPIRCGSARRRARMGQHRRHRQRSQSGGGTKSASNTAT